MSLTRVSPALFATSNNITSVTVGGSANTISLTFDGSGVITSATNNAVSVANTAITGNIISSQITSVANTQLTGTITGSQISSNTLSNTVFQTGSVENYMNAAGLGFGMRNRIINGAMVIDQRNAGASVGATNSAPYTLDRYYAYAFASSKYTVQQNAGSVTPPAGFRNYLGVTSSAATTPGATDSYTLGQSIEGFNISDLSWGTASASSITLSFKVYSSLTGTFGGVVKNSDSSRSYPYSYTISSANTWTSISIVIPGDTSGTWLTTNGIGIQLVFGLGVGSTYSGTAGAWVGSNYNSVTGATSVVGTNGATWYITGVQLEKGSTATSFDYRPYGTELQLCQRYYQKYAGFTCIATNTTDIALSIAYITTMRATPSVSQTGVLTIENMGVADVTQSSTSIALRSNRANATGAALTLTNFSGLTQFRPSIHNVNFAGTDNYITFSSEL